MANLRTFKKELQVGLEIVFEECFIVRDLYPDKIEEAEALIEEIIQLYKEARTKQKQVKDSKKSAKEEFNAIRTEYLDGIFSVLKKIEQLHEL